MKHHTNKTRVGDETSFDAKISPARRRELRAAMEFVKQARTRFDELGLITSARTERVAHDLAEICGVLELLSSRLQRITSQRSLNIDRTQKMLMEIQRELSIHLPYHLRQLKRPLEGLITDLSEGRVGPPRKRTRRAKVV